MNLPIYLDTASTTFPYKDCLQPFQEENYYYNASNLYNPALELKFKIEQTRKHMLELLGIEDGTILFTSGGCEGNNTVIKNVILYGESDPYIQEKFNKENKVLPHVITSEIEHHSVLNPLKQMERLKLCEVTYIKPQKDGHISPQKIMEAIKQNTILISIMSVNNELGTINDIHKIGEIAKNFKIYFHTDCTQSLGKFNIHKNTFNFIDFMTFSAHKFHGPKGVGGLYIKNINTFQAFIAGGNQEFELRAGTYNYPAIKGMEIALDKSLNYPHNVHNIIKQILISELQNRFGQNIRINSPLDSIIPILNFSLKNCDGEAISMQLAEHQIYTSNGSACNTGSLEPSYVLKSIDCPEDYIYGTIRISWDFRTTYEQIYFFIDKLTEIYKNYEVKNE